jgi:hypothetical protein
MRAEIKDKIVKKFVKNYGQDFYNLINLNLTPRIPQKKNGKITRPCNAFFQFRPLVSKYAEEKKLSIKDDNMLIILSSDQGYLAKVASEIWKHLPQEKKCIFSELHQQAKNYTQTTYPDYKYKPNRPKSIFKAGCQKKKIKKARAVRNVNTIIEEVSNNPPSEVSIDNFDQQLNVDLTTFQPSPPYMTQDVSDYIPQVIQNHYEWDSNTSPPLLFSSYPSPVSLDSEIINDSGVINDSEGFPFSVANNISFINNTLYSVPDDLIFPMVNFSLDDY